MNGTETFNFTQKNDERKYEDDTSNWVEQMTLGNRIKGSQVSISSVSSNVSDSSNSDYVGKLERKASLQDVIKINGNKNSIIQCSRRRSNSDGAVLSWKNADPHFEVFPSLPDSVLEKLGLRGDGPREYLSEEDVEQKFISLALAFTIDATTIKDRCDRQKRNRDLTEDNLSKEIEKFKEKLSYMQPLCTDFEKAELFSTLMTQIDVIINATSLVKIAAEKYGAVQHEDRLAESVDLMVKHLQILKQQRDFARKQLQQAKRVQQLSPDSPTPNPVHSPKSSLPNKKVPQRQFSLHNLGQSTLESIKAQTEKKKITRRTSELSLRASSSTRNARPARLDLGVDLVKIKEGFVDQEPSTSEKTPEIASETELDFSNVQEVSEQEEVRSTPNGLKVSLRNYLQRKYLETKCSIEETYNKWTYQINFHEISIFCALLCFLFSVIILADIYVEFVLARKGFEVFQHVWSWLGGNKS